MSSVKPMPITMTIRDRIRAIATEKGGPTALARMAGLAGSTVAQYLSEEKGRASEPGVEALIKLADAGGVSISWLAAGRGPKEANSFLPVGYGLFPYFDLEVSGWRIHGLQGDPTKWVALNKAWLDVPGVNIPAIECIEAPDSLPPINAGDLLAVDQSRGGDPHGLRPLNLAEGAMYVVAPEARILLRVLAWDKASKSIIAKAPGVRPHKIESFQLIGRIVWHGGRL